MAEFISADISKIAKFEQDSAEAIAEFDDIKETFSQINSTLLSKWKGEGANIYKDEMDHIFENIGGIKDVLDSINNSAVKDIKDNYLQLDNQLAEFNLNPQGEEN